MPTSANVASPSASVHLTYLRGSRLSASTSFLPMSIFSETILPSLKKPSRCSAGFGAGAPVGWACPASPNGTPSNPTKSTPAVTRVMLSLLDIWQQAQGYHREEKGVWLSHI